MSLDWELAGDCVDLSGVSAQRIEPEDGARQQLTAREILQSLRSQPGIVLADEVGMGKTYVALGVIASVLLAERGTGRPVVVMVPPGLATKWPREWEQFKAVCCRRRQDLDTIRTEFARDATAFFKLLDDPKDTRAQLIWMTTGCFSRGYRDPWIKLGLIRIARSKTRMDEATRKRLFKWAASLVQLKHCRQLDRALVERLLESDLSQWHAILVAAGILDKTDDDPIPRQLHRAHKLNFGPLVDVLRRQLPGHRGAVSPKREREARKEFSARCKEIYWHWVRQVDWHAALLVLDEAHHAKNDNTRLAKLLRSEDTERLVAAGATIRDHPLLWDSFDRMLFLTATPFQLGHQELIRVLKSFGGAKWTGDRAPARSRKEFFEKIDNLNGRLDANRLAGKYLDKLWGNLTWDQVHDGTGCPDILSVDRWWQRLSGDPRTPLEAELLRSVNQCRCTKETAESDSGEPWASIRTWVIRHNRPVHLTTAARCGVPRRRPRPGAAVSLERQGGDDCAYVDGLQIPGSAAVPFLLAARAQGELAAGTAKTRAYFAEGLCSSYEAFHHTREQRGDARDVDDDGVERTLAAPPPTPHASIVPVTWYESQIDKFVPSKQADLAKRLAHPKLLPVVERAVSLWSSGEKVLIFCFYRETAKALREHLRRKVEEATFAIVAEKLKIPNNRIDIRERLESIARRLSDEESPFYEAIRKVLSGTFAAPRFAILRPRQRELLDRLLAYIRTPSFIARYLPLEDPAVSLALSEGERRTRVMRAGAKAMADAIVERQDRSGVTMMRRVTEYLSFAAELAERAHVRVVEDEEEDDVADPLEEYLKAVSVYVSPRGAEDQKARETGRLKGRGAYRVLSPVRMVFGKTGREVRERVMLAFNSPLFPEILISSGVLGEGVDLHRFCRYVIHHDLCWNPSTLEQRTGRLDRIRCKAEWVGEPIEVFEPFLSGSADEKMFRVLRDRERWFQIVMGQEFSFDERTSEEMLSRVPLPTQLGEDLVFDLARYRLGAVTEAPAAAGSLSRE